MATNLVTFARPDGPDEWDIYVNASYAYAELTRGYHQTLNASTRGGAFKRADRPCFWQITVSKKNTATWLQCELTAAQRYLRDGMTAREAQAAVRSWLNMRIAKRLRAGLSIDATK